MLRCPNSVASFTALVWFLGSVLSSTLAAQSVGSRRPDVTNWRLFHRNNDAYWARRVTATTGKWDPVDHSLPVFYNDPNWAQWVNSTGGMGDPTAHSSIGPSASDVRKIRLLSGIADDEPSDPIVLLSGWRMKQDQYLLVTAKSGGCRKIAVYGDGLVHFKELWSSDATAKGGGICQLPGCPEPQVSVDEEHRINISTYSRSTPEGPVCDQFTTTTFEPRGSTFELQDQHTAKSRCWVGYGAGLDAALWQAAGPYETIGIVQVASARSPVHYALALQRDAAGAHVLRMDWAQKDWYLAALWSEATASECFSEAASVQVKVNALEVSQSMAEDLATALNGIDLRTDRCPRDAEGECAMFVDGRSFHVQVRGHVPINLINLRGMKGYTSENPQLSAWINRLLDEAKRVREDADR
jgi:hypothetical protein